jgi:hypothetical protein
MTWQGPLGPHCHASRRPGGATLSLSTSLIRGMAPTLPHKHRFHVSSSNGHDSLTLDPWAHCHPLEGHQLTLQPPYLGANRDPMMQWRCIRGPVGALTRSPGAQGTPTASLLPTNTPSSLVL